jgi:hypothetical protein
MKFGMAFSNTIGTHVVAMIETTFRASLMTRASTSTDTHTRLATALFAAVLLAPIA